MPNVPKPSGLKNKWRDLWKHIFQISNRRSQIFMKLRHAFAPEYFSTYEMIRTYDYEDRRT